jgi:hypothetical protein
MRDDVSNAYAVLGLPPGASLPLVKRQYRSLVRKWHPDRFIGDPQGIAEATQKLRIVNRAYDTLDAHLHNVSNASDMHSRRASEVIEDPDRRSDAPITQQQIDEIIQAIGRSRWLSPSGEHTWRWYLPLFVLAVHACVDIWMLSHDTSRFYRPLPLGNAAISSVLFTGMLAVVCLPSIWYDIGLRRPMGWAVLFVFAVLPVAIPVVAEAAVRYF